MKRIITILLLIFSFSSGIAAQSFSQAIKSGLSPLTAKSDSASSKKTSDTKKKEIVALTLKDGTVYTGHLKGKRPHGYGKAIYKNGDTYEGEFVKGKRHGKGVYRFKDGEWYSGDFYNDRQHGKGEYHFSDGRKYPGDWENDFQHGYGRMD